MSTRGICIGRLRVNSNEFWLHGSNAMRLDPYDLDTLPSRYAISKLIATYDISKCVQSLGDLTRTPDSDDLHCWSPVNDLLEGKIGELPAPPKIEVAQKRADSKCLEGFGVGILPTQ